MSNNLLYSLALSLLAAVPLTVPAAVPDYDQTAALAAAKADVANWQKYLPDEVFVAHVSIPGTHDAATGYDWVSGLDNGAKNSTTQEKKLDEQLAGGVRAFDFRPGMNDGTLYCNHGVSRLKLTLAEAFTILTDYLDAHPSEFYVIHLFRGNVYSLGSKPGGSGLLGAKDDAESIAQYNELFNQFFNQGKFADYIVDYNPYLKVGDIRGKMVIFRRDRIDFAHVAKAGNVTGWPADTANWTESSIAAVSHASDPTIKGRLRATDVSSPANDGVLQTELNSLTNLFSYNCNLDAPNVLKAKDVTYKPDWTMMFTSGSLYNENTNGYLENATYTNPHFTDLLRTAQASGESGPTGTVFSDWVLTDSHKGYGTSTVYETKGVDLVPAIYENNFYYIKDYILDDELFKDEEVEELWDSNKEYFLLNIGTGQLFTAGANWGTHAALGKYGIRVKPVFDKANATYSLITTFRQGNVENGLGSDYYIDNSKPIQFQVKRAGIGRFVFYSGQNAMAATSVTNTFQDGTEYIVEPKELNETDPMQQWELIAVEDYFSNQIATASQSNPVDISYMIRGHRFMPNDGDNPKSGTAGTWVGVTNSGTGGVFNKKTYSSQIACDGTNAEIDKELVLHCYNEAASGYSKYTNWSLKNTITGLPDGLYNISFQACHNSGLSGNSEYKFEINGINVKELLKVNDTTDPATVVSLFRSDKDSYTVSLDFQLAQNASLTFDLSKPGTSSATHLFVGDITLIYMGPDPVETCGRIRQAIDDATAKVATLPAELQEGWIDEMAKYETMIASQNVVGDGTSEVMDIYTLLRARVYRNTEPGADFTAAIINNSFEMGTGFGWQFETTNGSVVTNTGDWEAEGTDGNYMYNAWWTGVPVSQTLYCLPAGHYKLQALASSSEVEQRWVYFLANGGHSDAIEVPSNNKIFTEVEYEFDVAETGDVNIGMVGAAEDGSYAEFGGRWFKADNFRLTYMGEPLMDSFYASLEDVIADATARVGMIPVQYRAGWEEDMAPYRAIIENRTLEGDGSREAEEIYALMRACIYSQDFAGADFTAAIINNSFERGNLDGWTINGLGDSGVKPNSNSIYTVDNCDGDYLFNTWNGDDWGSPVAQTLAGLPAGRYRLEALLTSDAGNGIWLTADREGDDIPVSQKRVCVSAAAKTEFVEASLEFTLDEVTDVTIGAVGATSASSGYSKDGGKWYKADNFRLTLVAPQTTVEWTMEGDVYDTIILPFDAELPEGYEACSTSQTDVDEGPDYYVVNLTSEGRSLKANVPYIVRAANAAARSSEALSFTGVPVNDRDSYTAGVLTGTHAGIEAAAGHYVLAHSAEGSWFSIDAPRTVGAAHAYISNDDTPDFDFTLPTIYIEQAPDDVSTGIEGVEAPDGKVAVYNVAGVLLRSDVELSQSLEGLESGVYIVRGANATVKVQKR